MQDPTASKNEDSKIEDVLWRFKEDENLSSQDKDMFAFRRLLWNHKIKKIQISGFKNGTGGHVLVPASLLGSVEEAQLLFIKCKPNGNPIITEKLIVARAHGLQVIDSRFLLVWASSSCVPATLQKFTAANPWGARANRKEVLVPLVTPIFGGQTFCFMSTVGWLVSSDTLTRAITKLGGTVVSKEDRWLVTGALYSLSSVDLEGEEELYEVDWVLEMIVAGRCLRKEAYKVEKEEELLAGSQVCGEIAP